jgi:hypothetical protein
MMAYADAFRPETLVAIDAVKRALAIARRGIGAEDITAKGGRDLVTATAQTRSLAAPIPTSTKSCSALRAPQ